MELLSEDNYLSLLLRDAAGPKRHSRQQLLKQQSSVSAGKLPAANLKAQQQARDRISKMSEDHVTKRYGLSYKLYEIVKIICFENEANQNYFIRYIQTTTGHIGQGDFVCDVLSYCTRSNLQTLNTLYKLKFQMSAQELQVQQQQQKELNLLNTYRNTYDNFFSVVVKKLRSYQAYSKDDILRLLGSCCGNQDFTIFANQEKIYKSLQLNRQIVYQSLLKFIRESGALFIELKERVNYKYVMQRYEIDKFAQSKPELVRCMIEQIYFMATIAANRNYTCREEYTAIFNERVLLKYIRMPALLPDIRASLMRMMQSLHIDREPRAVIIKPNMIKVIEMPKARAGQDDASRRSDQLLLQLAQESQISLDAEGSTQQKAALYKGNRRMQRLATLKREATQNQKTLEKKETEQDAQVVQELQAIIRDILEEGYRALLEGSKQVRARPQ